MNTIDTSFAYDYDNSNRENNMSNSISSYNSSSSPRNSRFEIYFDQYNKQINSPLNARLMYYKTCPRASSRVGNFHSEQSSPVSSPRNSTIQPNIPQQQQQQNPQIPPLLRSVSLPSMNKQQTNTPSEANSPIQSHPRKSSVLSNCTHSSSNHRDRSDSCVSCEDSIITINNNSSGGQSGNDEDSCRRHHHRRESIAIKFKNPQIIDDEEKGGIPETDVFESLKGYEMKY